MTKPELIQQIISQREYKLLCRKYLPHNDLANDLFQELLLIILEYPESKIEQVKCASCFVVRIIKNMAISVTSPFYRKYRTPGENEIKKEIGATENYFEIQERANDREKLLAVSQKAKDELYWFDREVLEQYIKVGSMRELSKKTRISTTALHASINRSRKIIKEKCQ